MYGGLARKRYVAFVLKKFKILLLTAVHKSLDRFNS